MPKKSSSKKQKRVFRSKEEIQGILKDVAAAQAGGEKLMAILKKLNIPYNTYNKWTKTVGKAVEATAPVAKKAAAKVVAGKKGKQGRMRYTPEQKDEMRARDKALKADGKTDKQVADILGVAMPTLYKMRKDAKGAAKKSRGAVAAVSKVQLSPDNPMYQLALAHEGLIAINREIEELTVERDKLAGKMKEMMEKAAKTCPGLKKGKKK